MLGRCLGIGLGALILEVKRGRSPRSGPNSVGRISRDLVRSRPSRLGFERTLVPWTRIPSRTAVFCTRVFPPRLPRGPRRAALSSANSMWLTSLGRLPGDCSRAFLRHVSSIVRAGHLQSTSQAILRAFAEDASGNSRACAEQFLEHLSGMCDPAAEDGPIAVVPAVERMAPIRGRSRAAQAPPMRRRASHAGSRSRPNFVRSPLRTPDLIRVGPIHRRSGVDLVSIRGRSGKDLRTHDERSTRDGFAVGLGSIGGRLGAGFGVHIQRRFGSIWGRSDAHEPSVWAGLSGPFGFAVDVVWFGSSGGFGSIWGRSGVHQKSIWAGFRVDLEHMLSESTEYPGEDCPADSARAHLQAAFLFVFAAPPDLVGRRVGCGADCGQRLGFLSEISLSLGAALVLLPFCLGRHQAPLMPRPTVTLARPKIDPGPSPDRHRIDPPDAPQMEPSKSTATQPPPPAARASTADPRSIDSQPTPDRPHTDPKSAVFRPPRPSPDRPRIDPLERLQLRPGTTPNRSQMSPR